MCGIQETTFYASFEKCAEVQFGSIRSGTVVNTIPRCRGPPHPRTSANHTKGRQDLVFNKLNCSSHFLC